MQTTLARLPEAAERAPSVARRKRQRVPKATRADEFDIFLRDAPSQTYRDLFVVIRWAGLRISEAVGLTWESVDLDALQIIVIGKGDVERAIDILPEAEAVLRRRRAESTPATHVFGERTKPPPSARSVQRWMQRIAEANGIPRERATPHKLRHSYATNALNDGVPLHIVKEQLGHANISTTSTYLHAVPGQMRRYYERREP